MKLIADEGVDKSIVDALRAMGFTVQYFAESGAGASDEQVLAAANDAMTLLLTGDKDFGELVFRQRLTNSGVVLIRLAGLSTESKGQIVANLVREHGSEMDGAFSVITPGLLRIRHRINDEGSPQSK